MTDTAAPTTLPGETTDRALWRLAVLRAGITYLLSRVLVMVGSGVVAAQRVAEINRRGGERPANAVRMIVDVLTSWDGAWYLRIVRDGYPRSVPAGITYEEPEARAAFFPLFPTLTRWLDSFLPGGDVFAALALNFVLGAAAIWIVGLLAKAVFDVRVAGRAMVLMALFPGSFVLSFAYSEALLLVLAAGTLLMLHREQWLWAGVLAMLATATRPNAVALVAACAVASFLAIRRSRDWGSLVAIVLSPLGFVAFQWWIGWHAGERGVWFRVQREAWREGTSFGGTAIDGAFDFLRSPLSSPTDALTTASMIALAVLVYAAWHRRLPAPWVAYSAVVVALMLLPATVTARPRFLYTAVPLLIALAVWFERPGRAHPRVGEQATGGVGRVIDRDQLWTWTIAACAGGLAVLPALYGVFGAIP